MRKTPWWVWLLPLPVVWWAALAVACRWQPGMKITALLDALNSALAEPFVLAWVRDSPRFLLVFTVVYTVVVALCGGIAVADGELCWPLPGHTYISCHFGEVDAFGNAGHRGTDIPAPEGTPILAAHSGTVLVSGWNDSYGNQVLLDNGAGLSTRYAHMTQTAVNAGEAVTAGQVMGYVGSTGDSTGNHLHFEVMQGGVRVDPLSFVS